MTQARKSTPGKGYGWARNGVIPPILAAFAVLVAASGGHAQPAPSTAPLQGAKLFTNHCAACHSTVAGETRVGPSLHAIAGQKAALQADYPYSEALRARGAAGLVWTPENLDAWLADTSAFVPGTTMAYHQADPQKRAAIVAYISELKP